MLPCLFPHLGHRATKNPVHEAGVLKPPDLFSGLFYVVRKPVGSKSPRCRTSRHGQRDTARAAYRQA
jgi:hypothetical protein